MTLFLSLVVSFMHVNVTLMFLFIALEEANCDYSSKVAAGESTKEKTLLTLAWNVDDLSRLNQLGHKKLVELIALKESLDNTSTDLIASNVARRLTQLHENHLLTFVKGIFWYH